MDHHYRQSFINDFYHCPDMARMKRAKVVPDRTTDSALFGTAFHEGVELVIAGHIDGVGVSLGDAAAHAIKILNEGTDRDPGYDGTFKTLGKDQPVGVDFLGTRLSIAMTVWWENWWTFHVLEGNIEPVATEVTFDELLIERPSVGPCKCVALSAEFDDGLVECLVCNGTGETPPRRVFIQGTVDLVAVNTETGEKQLFDWKTSAQEYGGRQGWKHQRYSIQPTMYAAALSDAAEMNFTFVRVGRDSGDYEEFTVNRKAVDTEFLVEQLEAMAVLDEAQLERWPLGPTDWWCSSKWCPAWNQCRGKYLGLDPWANQPEYLVDQLREEAIANGNPSEMVQDQAAPAV